MGRLPDRVWRRCIELFLMAGKLDEGGALPNIKDICWILRIDQATLEEDFRILASAGIIIIKDDNAFVTHFAERQDRDTGAERIEHYRERQRESNPIVTKSYKDVTVSLPKPVQELDIDIDIDKTRIDIEQDTEEKPEQNSVVVVGSSVVLESDVYQAYESNIGKLTQFISDDLGMLIDDYTAEWVQSAIKIAVENNHRNIKYIKGILKNWQARGRDAPKSSGNGKDYISGEYAAFINH